GLDSLMFYNSSDSIMRKFCKMCGSNIEWSGSKDYPDWVSVAISTLDTLYEPLFIEDIFNRSTESE
ncbi:MAG: GFA family protein, partial [Pseudomonadales bacterium]